MPQIAKQNQRQQEAKVMISKIISMYTIQYDKYKKSWQKDDKN